MNFVRAETIVQEITDDGKVRDIITQVKKSEAEQEAERREHVLRSLPEFYNEMVNLPGNRRLPNKPMNSKKRMMPPRSTTFTPSMRLNLNLGGGFKYFLFSTLIWGRFPVLPNNFQMGWFNHQLPRNIINRLKMRSERRRES